MESAPITQAEEWGMGYNEISMKFTTIPGHNFNILGKWRRQRESIWEEFMCFYCLLSYEFTLKRSPSMTEDTEVSNKNDSNMTWWGFSGFNTCHSSNGAVPFLFRLLALFSLWLMTLLVTISMLWLQKWGFCDNESVMSFVIMFVFAWLGLCLCFCCRFSSYRSGLLHWDQVNLNIFPDASAS